MTHSHDPTVAQTLLAAGVDANAISGWPDPALMYAVAGHDISLVRLRMAHQADPMAVGSKGETLLKLATERGDADLIPLLQ